MKTELPQITFMRVALGLYLVLYYAALSLRLGDFFGPGSMVDPSLVLIPSPLFLVWNQTVMRLLIVLLFALTGLFIAGYRARLVLVPLFALHLAFHHANPYIIHEPQQLTNLLLVCGFFIPIERGGARNGIDAKIVKALNAYLGCYYFIAGAKKLSDPLWRRGEALWNLVQWDPGRKWGAVPDFLIAHPNLCRLGSWAALLFELSFIFLVFTRARPWLMVAGLLFHLTIYLTLEVGSFSYVMLPWYALLLDPPTRDFFARLLRREATA